MRPGDFFVSRGNGSLDLVGRASFAENAGIDVAFPDTMIRVTFAARQLVNLRFVAAIWNSQFVRQQIVQSARTSAGIHKINQVDLARIRLPVPPVKEQGSIVDSLRASDFAGSRPGARITAAPTAVAALRQSILKRAFEGRLVPQDPNDEPAAVLLECIRAARGT